MDDKDSKKDDSTLIWGPEKKNYTWYRIDPSKIKTVKDIALLLDAINIKFQTSHPEFDLISHLLKKEENE